MGGILRNQRTPPVGGLVRTKILVHSLHARARGAAAAGDLSWESEAQAFI
jgi:hypothetical protein